MTWRNKVDCWIVALALVVGVPVGIGIWLDQSKPEAVVEKMPAHELAAMRERHAKYDFPLYEGTTGYDDRACYGTFDHDC